MKKQIILISGGMAFEKYEDFLKFLNEFTPSLEYLNKKSWKDNLQEELGSDFDVVKLQMPNKMNAKYSEWKIYFEKYAPLFNDEIILIGHSLGGIFLAKHLSENEFQKKIKAVILVAPPFTTEGMDESLGDFEPLGLLGKLSKQVGKIYLLFSKDDPIVPFNQLEEYKTALPSAEVIAFENKEHFGQESFPELLDLIKSI